LLFVLLGGTTSLHVVADQRKQALVHVLCKSAGNGASSGLGGAAAVQAWEECRLDSARALANLAAHDADNKLFLAGQPNALAALVAMLRGGGGEKGQAVAARAFFNLVSNRQVL